MKEKMRALVEAQFKFKNQIITEGFLGLLDSIVMEITSVTEMN